MAWLTAICTCLLQAEATQAELQEQMVQLYNERAADYTFHLQGEQDALEFHPKPLHRFYHAQTQDMHGTFYGWTKLGRPQVIGSIWSYTMAQPGPKMHSVNHEFHSLAPEPLQPVKIGEYQWRPQTGIEMNFVPDSDSPSDRPALRLMQMRQFARSLEGFSTRTATREELKLRVLPQPLLRWDDPEDPEVIDGAIFGFFAEWDPEIMLLIEARNTPDGPRWHYGVARFNYTPQRLERQGEILWQVDWRPRGRTTRGLPEETFFAVHRVEVVREDELEPSSDQ